MKFTRTIFKTLSILAMGTLPAAAQMYHASVLPAAPGTSCYPTAINGSGAVAAACAPATSAAKAVIWQNGTVTNLGALPGGDYASPTAINSLGVIVGDSDTSDFIPQAFISRNGSLLNIDPISSANIRAVGVTDTGVVFGNLTRSRSGNTTSWLPMMWTVDKGHPDRYRETILPKLQGGDPNSVSAFLQGSNNAGQAVGWVVNSIIGQRGGFWNNDAAHTVVALPPLTDGYTAIASALNDLGQAVGTATTPNSTGHAVLWQNDAAHSIVDLGTLPGDDQAQAMAVNNAGVVVGASSVGQLSRGFVYRDGAMQDLSTLIDPTDGVFAVTQATAINGAGQIAAYATSNGQPVALLLTPIQ